MEDILIEAVLDVLTSLFRFCPQTVTLIFEGIIQIVYIEYIIIGIISTHFFLFVGVKRKQFDLLLLTRLQLAINLRTIEPQVRMYWFL